MCGGGNTTWEDPFENEWYYPDGPPALTTVSACFDQDYFRDERGRGCEWYNINATTVRQCGRYDTWNDNFVAGEMCCACGGGLIRNISVPLIEPTC